MAKVQRCQEEQGNEAGQELCMGGLRDGVRRQAGRQRTLHPSSWSRVLASTRVRTVSEALHHGADQLKAEHRKMKSTQEFRACGAAPASAPARRNTVCIRTRLNSPKVEQHEQRPWKQQGARHCDAEEEFRAGRRVPSALAGSKNP